jgi:hypothetical protein
MVSAGASAKQGSMMIVGVGIGVAVPFGVRVAVGVADGPWLLPSSPHAAAKIVAAAISTMPRVRIRMGRLRLSGNRNS